MCGGMDAHSFHRCGHESWGARASSSAIVGRSGAGCALSSDNGGATGGADRVMAAEADDGLGPQGSAVAAGGGARTPLAAVWLACGMTSEGQVSGSKGAQLVIRLTGGSRTRRGSSLARK